MVWTRTHRGMMGRRRFIEVVREEVKLVGVGEEDAEDKRVRWRDVIGCGPPPTHHLELPLSQPH